MSAQPVELGLALARCRRRWLETLLTVLATAIAVAIPTTALLTTTSVRPSFDAQQKRLGAPDLFVTVPAGTAVGPMLTDVPYVTRTGSAVPVLTGAVGSGEHRLPVTVRVADPTTAPWIEVVDGRADDTAASAVVEVGLAAELGVRPGQTIEVAGSKATASVRVSGLVADLSRNRYPLTSPGVVYLSGPAAALVGVGGGQAMTPVWVDPDHYASADRGVVDAVRSGSAIRSITALDNSVTGLRLISLLTTNSILLFGLVALFCLVLFVTAGTRLRVVRDEREIGQLLATGWSLGRVRRLVAWERGLAALVGLLPGLAVGGAGAWWLTGRITAEFGAPPTLTRVPLVVAAIVAAVLGAVILSALLATRPLRAFAPAALLAGVLGRRGRDRTHTGPVSAPGVAAAAIRSRPGRSLLTILVTTLAVTTSIWAITANQALSTATRTPSVWGYDYDYRLDLAAVSDGTAVATAAEEVTGVRSATLVQEGFVTVGGVVSSLAQFLPVTQDVLRPSVSTGRLPRSDGEIAVGTSVAGELGLRPGSATTISGSGGARRVTVSGVVSALGNSGSLVLAAPAAAGVLGVVNSAVLVRGTHVDVARLSALNGGRVGVTTAADQIALPFATTLRWVLGLLTLALVLLALVVGVSSAAATSAEQTRTLALLRTLGAGPADLGRLAGVYAALLAVPSLVLGVVAGLVSAPALLGLATAGLGDIPTTTPVGPTAAVLAVFVLAISVAFAVPLARTARRAPVLGLRALTAV